MSFINIRKAAATIAAVGAVLTTAIGLAGPASAASEWNAIIPYSSPKVDLAQGPLFPTVARDSSGISFAESWKFEPASDGYVFITSRHWKDGITEMRLDIQDTLNHGPSNPGTGAPVGTSPRDGSTSQQWKVTPVTFGGVYSHSVITNRVSGLVLTFGGGGGYSYTQKPAGGFGEQRFVVDNL